MQSLYVFDFLTTISAQLKDSLEAMEETKLDVLALDRLTTFQDQITSTQGVYVLHYDGQPVYVGKANNVGERLSQHRAKLLGRMGIQRELIGYKALLLDKTMSTAANEKILISMFKSQHPEMWNGTGFGPKDPGQQRDTTKPGKFDTAFPIISDFALKIVHDSSGLIDLDSLFSQMKEQLPYVFRYDVPAGDLAQVVDLNVVPHDARSLLRLGVDALGDGWKGAIISYGMVLYKNAKVYRYGEEIVPSL